MSAGPAVSADSRCPWCLGDADYIAYHDHEWGLPVGDDNRLFQALSLEGFQAGLSWLTILRKRERFRQVFAGFVIAEVAGFGADDVTRLLADAGIVRHRGKIEAVIGNARRALAAIDEHGSLAAWLWRFEPVADEHRADLAGQPDGSAATVAANSPARPPAAAASLARELRRQGWRFVGPTTVHAFMQAVGMINDHAPDCPARATCEQARARFIRPG
ncbi:MAG: DNA-3-methyladenine glycosylase I [Xanthomonadales bacterium]|nr:DNA-3-methyladenine glycosylase I [Xanthomonadales bacterium]